MQNLSGVNQVVTAVNFESDRSMSTALPASMSTPVWTNQSQQNPWVAYQFLSGPVQSTDVITYTLPFGDVHRARPGFSGRLVAATATNYVGQNEPGIGGATGYTASPEMLLGLNLDYVPWTPNYNWCPSKNALLRLGGNFAAGGTVGMTYDSNGQPLTMAVNTTYSAGLCNPNVSNVVENNPTLAGTVQTTVSSATIVFSQSQTLTTSQRLKFSGDSTGSVYALSAGGTGTTFTLASNYAGTSGQSSATATVYGQIGNPAPVGTWSIVYDDVNATDPHEMPQGLDRRGGQHLQRRRYVDVAADLQ